MHIKTVVGIAPFLIVLLCAAPVLADDANIGTELAPIEYDGSGIEVFQDFEHEDGGEYKGWANVWIRNNCDHSWGDLHFKVFTGRGLDISHTWFKDADLGGYNPYYSNGSLSWNIDNDPAGAMMDLYFYDSPILSGQTRNFKVWTDNTYYQTAFFSLKIYPTAVPEPSGMMAIAGSLLGLAGFVWRKRR